MNVFNQNHPSYHRTIIITAVSGVVIGLFSIYLIIFHSNIIIRNEKRPNLVIESIPKIETMFSINLPNIPSGLKAINNNEQFIDSTNQESVVFDVRQKEVKEYVKLQPLTKINVDSILNSVKNSTIVDALLLLNLEFRIRNYGDVQGNIILLSVSDTNVFEDRLRSMLLKDKDILEKIILDNTESDKPIYIMKDSSYFHKFKKYFPLDFDNKQNFTIHFYFIYSDSKGNYYDSYYWVKYHFKGFNFTIYPQFVYKMLGNGSYVLDQSIFHYKPKKPTINDLIEFVDSRFQYEREFSKEEKNRLVSLFEKK